MRLLFITATRIGDAVISTGILRHLIEENPTARVTVACGPLAKSVFAEVPGLERIIVVDKKPFGRHWFDLWREIRTTQWDLVVDLRRSLVSYFVSTARRLRLQRDDKTAHRVSLLSQLIDVDPPAAPTLWLADHHQQAAEKILAGMSDPLAICPIAARPEKTWPRAKFEELVRSLTSPQGATPGAAVVLIGAEADRSVLEGMHQTLDATQIIDLIGCEDLMTVAAVLSKCRVAIANDSGLAHLAAAVGAPTVALFGPTRPDLYRPWGAGVRVVQPHAPREQDDLANLDVPSVVSAIDAVLA